MSHTVLNETSKLESYLTNVKEDSFIKLGGPAVNVFSNQQNFDWKLGEEEKSTFIDLRSNNLKILFSGGYGIYNFFQLGIPNVIRLAEEYPGSTFIFDYSMVQKEGTFKTFIPFAKKVLNLLGIENYFINNDKIPGILVNNFIQVNTGEANVLHKNVTDAVKLYRKAANLSDEVKPFRKIYLSRKNVMPRDYSNLLPGLSTTQDNRMYDEHLFEEYAKSLGLEVVYPEDFKTMEEQAQFFNEVALVLSTTSSGLANAMFMQERTMIVEMVTSMPFIFDYNNDEGSDGNEQIHHLYQHLSYLTNKEYVAIPNYTRQPADLIGIIEESDLLQKVLRG